MTGLASRTTTDSWAGAEPGAGPVLSGHTRISTQALTSVAQAAAAEVLHVPADHIKASWRDDAGLLALSLTLPVSIPPLTRVARDPSLIAKLDGPVWDQALAARAAILETVSDLTGSQLSRVDIRITGIRLREGGRVQ